MKESKAAPRVMIRDALANLAGWLLRSRAPSQIPWRLLKLVALLGAVSWATQYQAHFWPRDYARARAWEVVRRNCVRDGRDPSRLTGSRDDGGMMGDGKWCFSFIHQEQPRRLYGAWFYPSGDWEAFGGNPDEPGTAAYGEE